MQGYVDFHRSRLPDSDFLGWAELLRVLSDGVGGNRNGGLWLKEDAMRDWGSCSACSEGLTPYFSQKQTFAADKVQGCGTFPRLMSDRWKLVQHRPSIHFLMCAVTTTPLAVAELL